MTPTARTLRLLRQRGWSAEVVERHIPHTFITRDLWGFADVLAMRALDTADGFAPDIMCGVLAVQTTTGDNASKRLKKMLAEPRLRTWLQAGGKVELHSWAMRGAAGRRKLWTCAVREVTLEDLS